MSGEWKALHYKYGSFEYENELSDGVVQNALSRHRNPTGWWTILVDTERFVVVQNMERIEIWVRKDLLR